MTLRRTSAGAWLLWGGILASTTALLVLLRTDLDQSHAVLTLLLVVLGGSVAGGRMLGFALACASFALIDYFFQPPFDRLSINPAVAGTSGQLCGTLLLRQQWTGFDGAPKTALLNVQAPITRISSASNLRYCAESTPRKAPIRPDINAVARPIHNDSLAP